MDSAISDQAVLTVCMQIGERDQTPKTLDARYVSKSTASEDPRMNELLSKENASGRISVDWNNGPVYCIRPVSSCEDFNEDTARYGKRLGKLQSHAINESMSERTDTRNHN